MFFEILGKSSLAAGDLGGNIAPLKQSHSASGVWLGFHLAWNTFKDNTSHWYDLKSLIALWEKNVRK